MYCKHCGHELNSDNICTNPECPSNTDKNINDNNYSNNFNESSSYNEFRDTNGISISEMVAFVGDKKAEYYLDKWTHYQNNENFVSWNWPAFLCGFYWFWYRKMYSIMTIILAVSICGTMILPSWVAQILSLGITIGCGLFSNQLYMKHTTKKILSIKSLANKGVDYNVIMRRIHVNGGTTIAPIITAIVVFIFTILLIFLTAFLGASLIDSGSISLY